MKIIIETNELTKEEAENLMECMLTHYGWSCFVDRIMIGNKKLYDLEDKQWQKFMEHLHSLRINKRNKMKESLSTLSKVREHK